MRDIEPPPWQSSERAARAYTPFGGVSRGFAAFLQSCGVKRLQIGPVELYSAALVSACATLVTALVLLGEAFDAPLWAVAALCAIGIGAERQSVFIASNTQMSVAALPMLFAAVVYGPYVAMLVGACSVILDFGRPYTRWAIWTASRSLVGGLAGVAALAVTATDQSFGRTVFAVAVAALVEGVADALLNSLTVALRRTSSFSATMSTMTRVLLSTTPLYTPVVAALVYAYERLSPWTVLLFIVPAAAAHRLLLMYQEQRTLADELTVANARLERANPSFAAALVSALDARDHYTAGHSAAVAVYARDIAAQLGLSSEEQQLAHLSGLLHDIGKVGLPPGLLEKDGPLTLAERRAMQEHSEIGERILANVEDYADIARIVRHHHERVDGTGYPDGLAADNIPLISRIISVADAYNAMTSGRPYRDAMASGVARLRLAQAVATQFDLAVVAAFEAVLAASGETYRSGARADFAIEAQRHRAIGGLAVAATAS